MGDGEKGNDGMYVCIHVDCNYILEMLEFGLNDIQPMK